MPNTDRVSFRTSPIPSLLALIDRAASRSRRERSDWIRQVLYDVALAELAGLDVHEMLKKYTRQ